MRHHITPFEDAFRSTQLLRGSGSDQDQYFHDLFDGLFQMYIGLNKDCVMRSVSEQAKVGAEDDRLFATLLTYVPDLSDRELSTMIDARPTFVPLHEVDLQKRIITLTHDAPDGAIAWDSEYFNNNYVIFGDIFAKALDRANAITHQSHQFIRDAVQPLISPSLQGHIGARTLKAVCVPLAIPGAVSYVLKATVHDCGVGKVIMFDDTGVSLEGYLQKVAGLEDDLYLLPEQQIAMVRKEYRFDKQRLRPVIYRREYVNPADIGLLQHFS
jgi:hypothetical protein